MSGLQFSSTSWIIWLSFHPFIFQQRAWKEYMLCYLPIVGVISLFGDTFLSSSNADVAKDISSAVDERGIWYMAGGVGVLGEGRDGKWSMFKVCWYACCWYWLYIQGWIYSWSGPGAKFCSGPPLAQLSEILCANYKNKNMFICIDTTWWNTQKE